MFTLVPTVILTVLIADLLIDAFKSDDDGPETRETALGDQDDFFNGTDIIDIVEAGGGNDVVLGNGGNDVLFGDAGNDAIDGGLGDDRIFLGDGDDIHGDGAVFGGNIETGGDDLIRGGSGDDLITDAAGANTLFGDLGADTLNTVDTGAVDATADTLFGGFGDDVLQADTLDVISGGAGTDLFELTEIDVAGEPARITDAEAGETIRIAVTEARSDETLTTRQTGGDTEVLFRDEVLVVLTGVTDPNTLTLELVPNITT